MVEIEDVEGMERPSDMFPPATAPKKPEAKKAPFPFRERFEAAAPS